MKKERWQQQTDTGRETVSTYHRSGSPAPPEPSLSSGSPAGRKCSCPINEKEWKYKNNSDIALANRSLFHCFLIVFFFYIGIWSSLWRARLQYIYITAIKSHWSHKVESISNAYIMSLCLREFYSIMTTTGKRTIKNTVNPLSLSLTQTHKHNGLWVEASVYQAYNCP